MIEGFDGEENGEVRGSAQNGAIPYSRRSFVYFIGPANQWPVKIGISGCPQMRLNAMQTGFPYELGLLAFFVGGKREEVLFHAIFHKHRLMGEWFKRTPHLKTVIYAIRDGADFESALLTAFPRNQHIHRLINDPWRANGIVKQYHDKARSEASL
jgi:hypothetical protein